MKSTGTRLGAAAGAPAGPTLAAGVALVGVATVEVAVAVAVEVEVEVEVEVVVEVEVEVQTDSPQGASHPPDFASPASWRPPVCGAAQGRRPWRTGPARRRTGCFGTARQRARRSGCRPG